MNINTLLTYIDLYGYLIIFLFLFFGIVGVPAPEESLLFLIGVLSVQDKLSFQLAALCAFLGAFLGMLTAFGCGKYIGQPFINKYGKYIGVTKERWRKIRGNYRKNIHRTILFGFYMPGIRQVSPYFAGIAKIPFRKFFLFSLLGTAFWTFPFITAGYFIGDAFHVDPNYIPYIGVVFLFAFLTYALMKLAIMKRKESKSTSRD